MGGGLAAGQSWRRSAERAHLARAAKRGVDGGPAAGKAGALPVGERPSRAGSWRNRPSCFWLHRIEEVHRNVGIPGWYVGSGIHRNAGPGGGPDDFCVLGGSLRCRPLDGARPENRGPSSKASRPGRAGFSAVNRSGVREAASRTGRKNSAGAGVLGVRAHFRRIWPSCCGGALSKNNNCGWNFLERVGNCCKGWFVWKGWDF